MRIADHEVHPQFVERWSPRAMSGEPLTHAEMRSLFEAARWAPSSGNGQPWRFAYALAKTPAFETFFDLLVESNRVWCARAGALVVLASRAVRDTGASVRTHALDAGAAWMSMALQGQHMGLVVHGMAGFDYDRAHAVLGAPDAFVIQAMIALGRPGNVDDLPEKLRAREVKSGRDPIDAFVAEGSFGPIADRLK
jgi:nitroreductase